ncbi:MAG: class I SAM-dependent methyltransferase [Bacilli bacterium]|nr:class I SAM-dependent methyltransferase [Bacilli bacterium]
MNDYFGHDEYWKEHMNESLEADMWIDEYKSYFNTGGLCLDLGCGMGQFTKRLMEYGYEVIPLDISEIALNKVQEFNSNILKADMRHSLPFHDETFDLVFANLSIHYFSDDDTKKLINEVKRILKNGGLFIGSVNGIKNFQSIKDTAEVLDYHFYLNRVKHIRLFDVDDLKKYLNIFKVLKIDEREITRFEKNNSCLLFFTKKQDFNY